MALDLKRPLYTVQELADYMKVTPMTIYRLIESGELTAKSIGDSVRFFPEDVEAFLAAAKHRKSKRGRKRGSKVKRKKEASPPPPKRRRSK